MSDELEQVTLRLCTRCLDGEGGECHTPGCALWMDNAPDCNLRERIADQGFTMGGTQFCTSWRFSLLNERTKEGWVPVATFMHEGRLHITLARSGVMEL